MPRVAGSRPGDRDGVVEVFAPIGMAEVITERHGETPP